MDFVYIFSVYLSQEQNVLFSLIFLGPKHINAFSFIENYQKRFIIFYFVKCDCVRYFYSN